jgi:hypothetical protein
VGEIVAESDLHHNCCFSIGNKDASINKNTWLLQRPRKKIERPLHDYPFFF